MSRSYYERIDGVMVWYSTDHFYSNPEDPNARLWEIYGSDGRYLAKKTHGRFRIPRRFKTPESAMRTADREILIDRED